MLDCQEEFSAAGIGEGILAKMGQHLDRFREGGGLLDFEPAEKHHGRDIAAGGLRTRMARLPCPIARRNRSHSVKRNRKRTGVGYRHHLIMLSIVGTGLVRRLERDLRNCCRSLTSPGTCGGSCAPPTSSSVASWRCGGEPAPWSALSTNPAWTGLSMRSLTATTHNGKIAPSGFLHRRLDITYGLLTRYSK